MIHFFASDLDGTFLKQDKTYNHEYFARVLAEIKRQNGHFVIATGRDIDMVRRDFAEFIGQVDLIVDNGALVETADQKILQQVAVPTPLMAQAMMLINQIELTKGVIMVGTTGKYMLKAHRKMGAINDEFQRLVHVTKYIDDLDEIDEPIVKMTFGINAAETETFMHLMAAELGTSVHVTTSGYGSIDIVAQGVNKATGIAKLAEYYQIPAHQLMAFGDGKNDLEMLKLADEPRSMANGDQDIIQKFPSALADNEHDGVLKTIEAYLQNKGI